MRMPCKRPRLWLLCLALGIAGGAFAGFHHLWPKEPIHDGKPLSYWFHELPLVVVHNSGPLGVGVAQQYPVWDLGKR